MLATVMPYSAARSSASANGLSLKLRSYANSRATKSTIADFAAPSFQEEHER
jgi:hypothetical protein